MFELKVPSSENPFERALAEYRELTGDFQDFADLPAEVQSEIVCRAQAYRG